MIFIAVGPFSCLMVGAILINKKYISSFFYKFETYFQTIALKMVTECQRNGKYYLNWPVLFLNNENPEASRIFQMLTVILKRNGQKRT